MPIFPAETRCSLMLALNKTKLSMLKAKKNNLTTSGQIAWNSCRKGFCGSRGVKHTTESCLVLVMNKKDSQVSLLERVHIKNGIPE